MCENVTRSWSRSPYLFITYSPHLMKPFRYLCLLALFALSAGVTASSAVAGPQTQCPEGTGLVARFEWKGSGYEFMEPSNSRGLVSLSGDAKSISWWSHVDVDAVVLGGTRDNSVVTVTNQLSGYFTSENVAALSGQPAGSLDVQFCARSRSVNDFAADGGVAARGDHGGNGHGRPRQRPRRRSGR